MAKTKTVKDQLAELARLPKTPVGRKFKLELSRLAHRVFATAKRHHEAGHDRAFWEAVEFSEANDVAKPEWLREVLMSYAHDRAMGRSVKGKRGAPGNRLRNGWIFDWVSFWRTQQRPFGRSKKLRQLSFSECFKRVKQELDRAGVSPSLRVIEKTYRREKKRLLASK